MTISIIRKDRMVVIDGESHSIELDSIASMIHVIEWHDDLGWGEVQFTQVPGQPGTPNLKFTDFTPYEYLRQAWHARKRAVEDANANAAVRLNSMKQKQAELVALSKELPTLPPNAPEQVAAAFSARLAAHNEAMVAKDAEIGTASAAYTASLNKLDEVRRTPGKSA